MPLGRRRPRFNSLIGLRSYEEVRRILNKATRELTVLDTLLVDCILAIGFDFDPRSSVAAVDVGMRRATPGKAMKVIRGFALVGVNAMRPIAGDQ
jgi:hypothetical protein